MQQKLKEAMDALSVKTQAVADLSATLDAARADAEASQSSLLLLQQERAAAVSDLQELSATLQRDRVEHSRVLVLLESMKRELDAAKLASFNHNNVVYDLQSQVGSLTAEVAAARENLETLRASSEKSSSEAAAAAQSEREAVLRARTDYETISAELEALRASHTSTIQDLHIRSSEAQERAADADALEAQVRQLKAEREENANKLSELEVEILELKESQEQAEDDHTKVLDRLKKLEEELAHAAAATQSALAASKVREEQHAEQLAEVKETHSGELQTANDELSDVVADLAALRDELAAAHAAHERTKIEAQKTAEEHERQIEETESEFLSKHLEFSEEIKRLTIELESQEAHYNTKVDAVKAEHDLLLQEAFERAKNEAADVHGEDLQALRAESQATIEQLRTAHQSTVDGLKADHEDVLASQVGDLEKKLSNQSLELRATQDDLAKAKTALESSRSDTESLKAQLEDARAAFVAASASADQASEIDRLTKELANFRDENVMLNDVLAVTKESLSEMSSNHTKELEEAARGRVEDVMSLRAAHEEEIGRLAAQKSELSLQLSDLEGEIATLRAQIAAEAAAAPRNSGAMSPSLTMVTREELQRVHEAHNMKMQDVVADHERIVRDLRNEIDGLQNKLDEVHQDIARKSMEIQYLEQEQEESQDSITRYVKVFGLQSVFGVVIALAVIFDFI
jgi:chromosome segregation ATPase